MGELNALQKEVGQALERKKILHGGQGKHFLDTHHNNEMLRLYYNVLNSSKLLTLAQQQSKVQKSNRSSIYSLFYRAIWDADCERHQNDVEPGAEEGDGEAHEDQSKEPNDHPEDFGVAARTRAHLELLKPDAGMTHSRRLINHAFSTPFLRPPFRCCFMPLSASAVDWITGKDFCYLSH